MAIDCGINCPRIAPGVSEGLEMLRAGKATTEDFVQLKVAGSMLASACDGPIEVAPTITETPLRFARLRGALGFATTRQIVEQNYECGR